MVRRARALLRWRSGHGVLLTFVVAILVPGLLIAVIGFRALLQERRLSDQQIREQVDRAAALAARDLEQELRQWQEAVDEVARLGSAAVASWPDRLAFEEPGSSVVMRLGPSGLSVFPPGRLLYKPTEFPRTSALQPVALAGLTEAESAELRQRDYARATLLYERLLATAEPDHRPLLVHRLARTYRKAGRLDDAVRGYQELRHSVEVQIGDLPADFIAMVELCALWADQGAWDDLATGSLELYRGLVSGRWSLEKSRYVFYSHRARGWLARDASGREVPASPHGAEFLRLQGLEDDKLALTRVVEDLLASPRRLVTTDTGAHLAFWHDEPFVVLVLSERLLAERVWPRTFAPTTDQQLDVAVRAANGHVLFGSIPDDPPALAVTRSVQGTELPWQVQVWPHAPEALYASLVRRQNLYLAMLVLVSALLIVGTTYRRIPSPSRL